MFLVFSYANIVVIFDGKNGVRKVACAVCVYYTLAAMYNSRMSAAFTYDKYALGLSTHSIHSSLLSFLDREHVFLFQSRIRVKCDQLLCIDHKWFSGCHTHLRGNFSQLFLILTFRLRVLSFIWYFINTHFLSFNLF